MEGMEALSINVAPFASITGDPAAARTRGQKNSFEEVAVKSIGHADE